MHTNYEMQVTKIMRLVQSTKFSKCTKFYPEIQMNSEFDDNRKLRICALRIILLYICSKTSNAKQHNSEIGVEKSAQEHANANEY